MWEQPFGMIMVIVFIGAATGLISAWMKQRENGQVSGEELNKIQERLDRIEKRMANIETIVIDREKKQEFERVL